MAASPTSHGIVFSRFMSGMEICRIRDKVRMQGTTGVGRLRLSSGKTCVLGIIRGSNHIMGGHIVLWRDLFRMRG